MTTEFPKIEAPFTLEQVQSINDYQSAGCFHPMTCASDDEAGCHGHLVADTDGLKCFDCSARQTWVHAWMADWSWIPEVNGGGKPMLPTLHAALDALPELLRDPERWQSLHVTYHPPEVERLWTPFQDGRLFLHRIHPCGGASPLWHPHPWPSAVRLISGRYQMGLVSKFKWVRSRRSGIATMILSEGSEYEMVDPDGWHYVEVLGEPSLSVMVTGAPWKGSSASRSFPKPEEPQGPLSEKLRDALFESFRAVFSGSTLSATEQQANLEIAAILDTSSQDDG